MTAATPAQEEEVVVRTKRCHWNSTKRLTPFVLCDTFFITSWQLLAGQWHCRQNVSGAVNDEGIEHIFWLYKSSVFLDAEGVQ